MNTQRVIRWGAGFCFLCSAAAVLAAEPDAGRGFTLSSRSTLSTDNNFFLAGAGQERSEQIFVQTFGVKLQLPVSLQQFELDYDLSASKHQHFSNFDNVDKNYRAALLWAYTPRLRGSLYTTRADTLNAPQDSLNPTLRNTNTSTSTGFSVNYGLFGPWQLQAALGNDKSTNEQALLGVGNTSSNNVSVGVRYAFSPAASLSYNLSRGTGNSSSTNAAGVALASDTRINRHQVSLSWALAARTTLAADLQHQSNAYDDAPAYDFAGWSGGAALTLDVTPKTSVAFGLRRALNSKQTLISVYSQSTVLSVNPRWQATPKVSVSLPITWNRVADQGGFAGSGGQTDTFSDAKLLIGWQPRSQVSFGASVQRGQRDSNLPGLDYVVQRTALDALFTF